MNTVGNAGHSLAPAFCQVTSSWEAPPAYRKGALGAPQEALWSQAVLKLETFLGFQMEKLDAKVGTKRKTFFKVVQTLPKHFLIAKKKKKQKRQPKNKQTKKTKTKKELGQLEPSWAEMQKLGSGSFHGIPAARCLLPTVRALPVCVPRPCPAPLRSVRPAEPRPADEEPGWGLPAMRNASRLPPWMSSDIKCLYPRIYGYPAIVASSD